MDDRIRPSARERILSSAYELFSKRGLRDVSVDEIITHSGVAIATFYRHFRSKDELAEAFLNRREELWSTDAVVMAARRRSPDPEGQILAIFDVFDEWFHRDDFEGDSFVNVLLEMGPTHPLGRASIDHLVNVRHSVRTIAEEAGLRDADEFAYSFHILMKGSIIAAEMGDELAARRAKHMAEHLVEEHRVTARGLR
jgi:AcrR family transcriptional regulator